MTDNMLANARNNAKQTAYTKFKKGDIVKRIPVMSAFDLLLKEAWNPELAAMGNSTLPLDK
jgi:hypothetical protein